jgi:hypothetical protein
MHTPAEHAFERVLLQLMQTRPLIPQSPFEVPAKQVPWKQQPPLPPPSGQFVGSQLPQPPCWHC